MKIEGEGKLLRVFIGERILPILDEMVGEGMSRSSESR
jgi:hypothetical protein